MTISAMCPCGNSSHYSWYYPIIIYIFFIYILCAVEFVCARNVLPKKTDWSITWGPDLPYYLKRFPTIILLFLWLFDCTSISIQTHIKIPHSYIWFAWHEVHLIKFASGELAESTLDDIRREINENTDCICAILRIFSVNVFFFFFHNYHLHGQGGTHIWKQGKNAWMKSWISIPACKK